MLAVLAVSLFALTEYKPAQTSPDPNSVRLYLFVRGMDNRIWYRSKLIPDGVWGYWKVLPEGLTTRGIAATPNPWYNRIDLVVRGVTGGLYHGWLSIPGETFSGWYKFSGDTPSRPVLAHEQTSEWFGVVVRGMDDGIWSNGYGDGYWHGWSTFPGATPDGPAAAFLDGDLHVVVRGMTGGLWHYYKEYGTWHGWNIISGETESAPVLAAIPTAYVDRYMFLVVRGTDNRVYYREWGYMGDGGWYDWDVLPTGATPDGPAATVLQLPPSYIPELHIVVRGMNGRLYYGYLDWPWYPENWSGWEFLGGETESPPVLVAFYLD